MNPLKHSSFPKGFRDGVTIRGVPVLNTYSENVLWVDSSGAQTGDGTYARPYAAVDTAINKASTGDIIICKEAHAETFTAAAGFDADVAGISIVSLGSGNRRATFTFTTAEAADVDIDAASITLSNLRFVCGINSQTAMIDVNAAAARIEFCEFTESSATGLTCIDVNGGSANACDKAEIIGNVFRCVTAANWDRAIELGEVADGVLIEGNDIIGDFDDAGIHNITNKVMTNLTIRNNYVRNNQSGQHAIELVSACTGVSSGNTLVTDAFATAYDAGALSCDGTDMWQVTTGGDSGGIPVFAAASAAGNPLGTMGDAAATGAVTTTDTVMAYTKQLVTMIGTEADTDPVTEILSGATGISTWKAGVAPGDGVSMSEGLRYVSENLGAVDTAAATGAVTATDSGMAYLKQVVTQIGVEADTDPVSAVLSGAGGITTWKAASLTGSGVSMSEVLRSVAEAQVPRITAFAKADVTAATAWTTGNSPVTIATVTGVVLARVFAHVTAAITSTGGTGTLALGVSDNVALWIAATTADATNFALNDVWVGPTTTTKGNLLNNTSGWALVSNDTIKVTIATNSMTAGGMTLYVQWLPISAGATVA